MLSELAIKKFAIIEDIRIRFKPGLSILTGETGAGKSIIIQAVNLLLGARASSDLVRTGEETAELEACFELEKDSPAARVMADQGMDWTEGLIIRRQVSRSGKSQVFINSRRSTLDFLKQLTRNLAGVASQHAHQGLLREENHLDILDEFAQTMDLRKKVSRLYAGIMPLKTEIRKLESQREEKIREQEFIQFQVDEIDRAAIETDEDESLERLKTKLMSAARIFETVNGAVHEIYDRDGSAVERIAGLKSGIERYRDTDPALEQVCKGLESVVFELQDLAGSLRDYSDSIDLDPESLEKVDQRLDLISKLKRKYGGSLASVFDQHEIMKQSLADTQGMDHRIQSKKDQLSGLEHQIRETAHALSEKRYGAANELSGLAGKELAALEMENAKFEVAFLEQVADSDKDIQSSCGKKITATGQDKPVFMLSPNPGEAPKPLSRIASGGELSRIVLALKAVLSRTHSIETLIFDEVDAGIGGATSEKVGMKLGELAGLHQVICITHLAQIAKYGNDQFRISKQVKAGRTVTAIVPLETVDDRVREIARMIGGSHISDATLAHARELLREASA